MILELEVMGRDVERGGREDRGVEGGSLWMIHSLGHVWVWAIYGYALPTQLFITDTVNPSNHLTHIFIHI